MSDEERYGRAAKYMEDCDYDCLGDDTNRNMVFECTRCGHHPFVAGDGCPTTRLCPVTWATAAKRLREEDAKNVPST